MKHKPPRAHLNKASEHHHTSLNTTPQLSPTVMSSWADMEAQILEGM
jgi:hypothetical protein